MRIGANQTTPPAVSLGNNQGAGGIGLFALNTGGARSNGSIAEYLLLRTFPTVYQLAALEAYGLATYPTGVTF
jgi:hypothetical protein